LTLICTASVELLISCVLELFANSRLQNEERNKIVKHADRPWLNCPFNKVLALMPRAEFRYCLDHVLFLHLERSQVDGKGKEKKNISYITFILLFIISSVSKM